MGLAELSVHQLLPHLGPKIRCSEPQTRCLAELRPAIAKAHCGRAGGSHFRVWNRTDRPRGRHVRSAAVVLASSPRLSLSKQGQASWRCHQSYIQQAQTVVLPVLNSQTCQCRFCSTPPRRTPPNNAKARRKRPGPQQHCAALPTRATKRKTERQSTCSHPRDSPKYAIVPTHPCTQLLTP
jgi:hypothetical protein